MFIPFSACFATLIGLFKIYLFYSSHNRTFADVQELRDKRVSVYELENMEIVGSLLSIFEFEKQN